MNSNQLRLQLRGAGSDILGAALDAARAQLAVYLLRSRWFAAKARELRTTSVIERIPLRGVPESAFCLVQAQLEDEEQTYLLPLAIARGTRATELQSRAPRAVIAELELGRPPRQAILFDALADPGFCDALLDLVRSGRRLRGQRGAIQAVLAPGAELAAGLRSRVVGVEQSNTSVIYQDQLILKLFRKLSSGVSPELELSRFLVGRYPHTPELAGWLEYRAGEAEPISLGVLQRFVPNQGDAWAYTLHELRGFFERALAGGVRLPPARPRGLRALLSAEPPPRARDLVGAYLDDAGRLGRRIGELHLALATPTSDPAFAAEPYSRRYQRSVHGSLRSLRGRVLRLLERGLAALPEAERLSARLFLTRQAALDRGLDRYLRARFEVQRIRAHGDLHLGQVLHTGKDFVLIDFEGEPARSLAERRSKRPSLYDVAGMLRSFHYAARSGLCAIVERDAIAGRARERLDRWAELWRTWCSQAFLHGYLATVGDAALLPRGDRELELLLETCLLEKALYELGYELDNRPGWVGLPLHGLEEILAGT